jgi:hypothetical protein
LWQSVHTFLDFDVDLSVLCELVQIVLFDRLLRERCQVDYHIFESSKGGVQIKILNVNDKEYGALGGNDTIDEDFCRCKTCCYSGLVSWIFNLVSSNGYSCSFLFLFVIFDVHYK